LGGDDGPVGLDLDAGAVEVVDPVAEGFRGPLRVVGAAVRGLDLGFEGPVVAGRVLLAPLLRPRLLPLRGCR
jgi:hypothetical protein